MRDKRCDVLVVGGGIAGIAAALAAARNGADVILLEKQCVLGGLATSGLVTIYLPLCDGRGMQLSYGIAEELLRLSILHGIQDKDPEPWLRGGSVEERKSVRFEVQFNPVWFELEVETLLLREGVRIFYDTRLCGAQVEEGVLIAVEAEDAEGRIRIECASAVDATGDAALFKYSGGEVLGNPMGNSVAGWYYASERSGLKLKMLGFADLADGSERDGVEPGSGRRFRGELAEEVNQYLYLSHQSTLDDLKLRQEKDAAFIEPALITSMPQFRMIRRIEGRAVMTKEDDGQFISDSVGMVGDWRKRGPRFEVPYGALCGKLPNLYAAGRIVSCDYGMWDVMRVIPCCAVTGEAAGTAAALNAKTGVQPIAQELQAALHRAGQRIHLNELDEVGINERT